ncbi:MAG: hypothetical protein WBA45_09695 [Microthrixaceae bacterium]
MEQDAYSLGLAIDLAPRSVEAVDIATVGLFARRTEARRSSAAQQVLKDVLEPPVELGASAGFELLTHALAELADAIQQALRGTDGWSLWTCLRHVSQVAWARPTDAAALAPAIRHVAETAVERFSDWGVTAQVGREPGEWSAADMDGVADILVAAESYALVMSIRRRVAKGQRIEVLAVDPWEFGVLRDVSVERWIETRDARVSAGLNFASVLGQLWPEPPAPRTEASTLDPSICVGSFVDAAMLAKDHEAQGKVSVSQTSYGAPIWTADVVAPWDEWPFLGQVVSTFAPFDAIIERHLGFSTTDLLAVLAALTGGVFEGRSPSTLPTEFETCGYAVLAGDALDIERVRLHARRVGVKPASLDQGRIDAVIVALSKGRCELDGALRSVRFVDGRILFDARGVACRRSACGSRRRRAVRTRFFESIRESGPPLTLCRGHSTLSERHGDSLAWPDDHRSRRVCSDR